MSGENIGTIKCQLCGEPNPVKEQKSGLAGYHCPWCGCNVYARAKQADTLLRGKMTTKAEPTLEPAKQPTKQVEPPPVEQKKKAVPRGVFGI